MPHYEYQGPGLHHLDAGDDPIEPGEVRELPESTVRAFPDRFREVEPPEPESAAESESSEEADDSPEDEDEVDESEAEAAESEEENTVEMADGSEVVVDPPLDPTDLTIEQLESELNAGDFTEPELDAIYSAERESEDRTGAVEVIEDALDDGSE